MDYSTQDPAPEDPETLFIMTAEQYFFVSSRNVKEVAALGCDISGLVPKVVADRVHAKFKSKKK